MSIDPTEKLTSVDIDIIAGVLETYVQAINKRIEKFGKMSQEEILAESEQIEELRNSPMLALIKIAGTMMPEETARAFKDMLAEAIKRQEDEANDLVALRAKLYLLKSTL